MPDSAALGILPGGDISERLMRALREEKEVVLKEGVWYCYGYCHERGDFRLIISTIESLPADRRTDAVLGELARAYNNLAQPGEDALFLRALDILQLTAESGEEDHLWHFRAGYALFHLDRLGEALQEFERALQLRPGDEDTMRFIAASQAGVTMPRFRALARWVSSRPPRSAMWHVAQRTPFLAIPGCGARLSDPFVASRFSEGPLGTSQSSRCRHM